MQPRQPRVRVVRSYIKLEFIVLLLSAMAPFLKGTLWVRALMQRFKQKKRDKSRACEESFL
jgi:hypothetical protein